MSKKAIGICKCHYSKLTIVDGTATFTAPVKIPDLENLTADNTYATGKNYADNVCNIDVSKLTGATISAEFSHVTRKIEAELAGRKYEKGGMLAGADDVQNAVAILYEKVFDDGSTERIVYYNCKLVRNANGGQTKTESINFDGVTLSGSAIPLPNGYVMYALASDEITELDTTTQGLFDNFFTAVPTPWVAV